MNYIEKNGLKCHWNFWLLPNSFLAITLFGHIFFNNPKDWVEKHLESYRGAVTLNHERIHVLQAKSFNTKYLGFYIVYLYYWIKNLFKYKFDNMKAYSQIPFEREAYVNEQNFSYQKTNWKKYIK